MIINTSYFQQGELYIPNTKNIDASSVGGVSNSAKAKVQIVIDRYERDLMINALGVTLYNQLYTLLDDNALEEPANSKWNFLVEGEDYTKDGKTLRWDGLRGYKQQSLVASYVFCEYMRENDMIYTTVGTVRGTAKNATSVTATPKYVDIWNRFVLAYQGKRYAMETQPKIIRSPSGEIGYSFYKEDNVIRSLYQYLTDKNEADATAFPDFEFKFYERKNSLGI